MENGGVEEMENCEMNNNIKEFEQYLADLSNLDVPKMHQREEKENLPTEPDVCKKIRKFLKQSIEKTENIDDDNVFMNLFKKRDLHRLCLEVARLHQTNSMSSLPFEKLELLLNFLERIMVIANEIVDSYSQDNRYALTDRSGPVFKAMYACLLELYIWMSPGIDKKIITDDGIESVTTFLKLSLQNIIFPVFDSSKQGSSGSTKASSKKRKAGNKKPGKMGDGTLQLYNDVTEAIVLLETFLRDRTLVDTHILRIDSFSIPAFFVDNTEIIQLALLKIVECVFSKYKHHRKALIDDILSSLEKSAADRRQYTMYKLETGEKIQMHTALLMKIIQSVAFFPPDVMKQEEIDFKVIAEEKIADARKAALYFMRGLFTMCSSNTNEGCRVTVVNLVQDLLMTVDRPQWPVSEIMLHMLVLVMFENHAASQQKKILALELLTVVYSALQNKTVQHKGNMHKIDQLFENMKKTEKDKTDKKCKKTDLKDSAEKVDFLQKALLDYITHRERTEPGLLYAKHFHLANWYIEMAELQSDSTTTSEKIDVKKGKCNASESRTSKGKSPARKSTDGLKSRFTQNNPKMKFLLDKFHNNTVHDSNMNNFADEEANLFVDVDAAQLIVHHFESNRPLHLNFNSYLKLLLNGLSDTSASVRLKAMRCLSHLMVVLPDLLSLNNVESAVKMSIYDSSIAIRESAIDIICKIVLSKSDLDDCHIKILSERILDTGVSVRKKVIKTLGDLCLKFPESQKTPEIAANIMKRINDEPGVHNMVLEFFYKLWFQPIDTTDNSSPHLSNQRISSIINVINLCMGVGLELFETLLTSLINPNEDSCDRRGMKNVAANDIAQVYKEIVDALVRNMFEESTTQSLLPLMTALYLFAKIKPEFVVRHTDAIQKLLVDANYQISNSRLMIYILRIIELAIPFMKHPNEVMLSDLECNFEKIIMTQEPAVIQNCISCLQKFTEKLTQNFQLVAIMMEKCYDFLVKYSSNIVKRKSDGSNRCDAETIASHHLRSNCKRTLFIVGLLMRYFNFCDKKLCCENLPLTITSDVVNVLDVFLRSEDAELQLHAIMALGNVCVRFCKLMLGPGLKGFYCKFLRDADVADNLKVQVLHNLKTFLENDRQRKMAQYNNWKERSKKESIKLMEDVSSGLSSSIIQLYLSDILALTAHKQFAVRHAAQNLIQIILQQGLVNPVQLVPNLIAISTEDNQCVRISAEKHIQDIEQRYPGFIHMKAQSGLDLSFQFQETIQANSPVVHGYRENSNGTREALLSIVYSTLHTKPHKRAFISSIIKRFEEQLNVDSKMMSFLVDNLAYFNYEVMGEPLFIIHSIDVFLSVNGTSILQSFEEALLPAEINNNVKKSNEKSLAENGMVESDGAIEDDCNQEDLEEEELLKEDSVDELLKRLPENIQPLVDCLKTSHKFQLLISLNQFLKTAFNISDCMMYQYSTLESSKVYEKPVIRSKKENFDVELVMKQIEGYISDSSEDARKTLIENYIKFKRLIMKFDFNRAGCDEYNISTTSADISVSKNIGKSQATKRRSSIKRRKSDDDDDDDYTPKSNRKFRVTTPKSEKITPSKNERNQSTTTPDIPFKRRSTRSSL